MAIVHSLYVEAQLKGNGIEKFYVEVFKRFLSNLKKPRIEASAVGEKNTRQVALH